MQSTMWISLVCLRNTHVQHVFIRQGTFNRWMTFVEFIFTIQQISRKNYFTLDANTGVFQYSWLAWLKKNQPSRPWSRNDKSLFTFTSDAECLTIANQTCNTIHKHIVCISMSALQWCIRKKGEKIVAVPWNSLFYTWATVWLQSVYFWRTVSTRGCTCISDFFPFSSVWHL